jgi:hypothetical protein
MASAANTIRMIPERTKKHEAQFDAAKLILVATYRHKEAIAL